MIRVVLDANVLISGLISHSGPPSKILDAWLKGDFELFTSPHILQELERVLNYPRISTRLSSEQILVFCDHFSHQTKVTSGKLKLDVLSLDPSDNIYLACAVEAKANYLVTGNLHHFVEVGQSYFDIKVLSPRDFLGVLKIY